VVPEVRSGLRPRAAPAAPQAGRQLAPRRGVLRVNGERHYRWRAVDQRGVVLDILVQDRRNATAAKRFFRRLLRGLKYILDQLRRARALPGALPWPVPSRVWWEIGAA
jgi:transposase-like protein